MENEPVVINSVTYCLTLTIQNKLQLHTLQITITHVTNYIYTCYKFSKSNQSREMAETHFAKLIIKTYKLGTIDKNSTQQSTACTESVDRFCQRIYISSSVILH